MRCSILFSALIWAAAASAAVAQPTGGLQGRWRIVSAVTAPWSVGPAPTRVLLRTGLIFHADGIRGEGPLNCADARLETIDSSPQSLFEGNLPEGQDDAIARDLGLPTGRIETLRVVCPNAGFDFHRSGPDRMLFAMDNVIYEARAVASSTLFEAAEFVQPAWPALDCVLASQPWERIVCEDPEASLAHALLAREGPTTAAARRAFLTEAARRCLAGRASANKAETSLAAACLAFAYMEERLRLREAAGSAPVRR